MVNTILSWAALLLLAAGPLFVLVIYVLHLLALAQHSRFGRWLDQYED